MTSQFHLAPSGPAAPCGYPGCVLDDFHGGDHSFREKPKLMAGPRRYHCIICKLAVEAYGVWVSGAADLCDSQECLLAWCAISAVDIPLSCPCSQRPYAHDVTLHTRLRQESYNPTLSRSWPWSLLLSNRVEPSSEVR